MGLLLFYVRLGGGILQFILACGDRCLCIASAQTDAFCLFLSSYNSLKCCNVQGSRIARPDTLKIVRHWLFVMSSLYRWRFVCIPSGMQFAPHVKNGMRPSRRDLPSGTRASRGSLAFLPERSSTVSLTPFTLFFCLTHVYVPHLRLPSQSTLRM